MPKHWRSPGRIGSRAGQNLRQRRLAIHPLCVECQKIGIIRPTDEIDHIKPLAMGGTDTDDNVQGLCFQHHAEKTAAEDVAHGGAANHPEWLEPSAIPLTIVCGPPASGKTTYVSEHAAIGDLTIDLDALMVSIDPWYRPWSGSSPPGELLNKAIRLRNAKIGSLARASHGRAWLIVSAPTKAERDWWARKTGGTIVLLHPGIDECKRRAIARGTPRAAIGVDRWEERSQLPWQAKGIKGSTVSGKPKDPMHPWNRQRVATSL